MVAPMGMAVRLGAVGRSTLGCLAWLLCQPLLSDHMKLMGVDPFGLSWWGSSRSATRGLVGKPVVRRPRLRSDSYDKYMSWTELLTYTMVQQDNSAPFGNLLVSLAKNAPSIEIGEHLAVDKLIWIGYRWSQ